MKKENLKQIAHLTIGDIIEFSPIMKLSIREAIPRVKEFSEKHKLSNDQIRDVGSIVEILGLYTY